MMFNLKIIIADLIVLRFYIRGMEDIYIAQNCTYMSRAEGLREYSTGLKSICAFYCTQLGPEICQGFTMLEMKHCAIHHSSFQHWMVVDGEGQRATQRTLENMALITQRIVGQYLMMDAPGMDTLELDLHPKFEKSQVIDIVMRGKNVKVLHAGDEASDWMNKFLERTDLKVVHLPPQLDSIDMTVFNKPHNYYARPGDVKALHDKAPFNMMSEASVADLQTRIPDQSITVHRFRPNIVVNGDTPYDEDTWKRVRIGKNYFTRVAMCSRCTFTTVNPDQPNKAGKQLEPLKTLREYRLAPEKNEYGQSPVLGAHFCPDNVGGHVKLGDLVYVIKEHY